MALCCSRCFEFCFGNKNSETSSYLYSQPNSENQPIRTVRRISSVGQTIVDENGEEKEIPRHSSILQSYDGVPVPWCTPTPIQPGVTREDLLNRIRALPTITEVSSKQKPKNWKKVISKSDNYSPLKFKEKISESPVTLKLFLKTQNISKSTELISSQDKTIDKQESDKLKTNEFSKLRRGSYGSSPNLSSVETSSKTISESSTSNYTMTSSLNSDKFDESKLLSPLNRSNRWMQSQSVESVNKSGASAKTPAELARQYGLDLSLYTQPLDDPDLGGNLIANVENLFIEKSEGTVELVLSFQKSEQQLNILVKRIEGLSGIGESREMYSVTFKLSVVGDKKQTKSGKKLPLGLNLHVNQYFTFHMKDINSKLLRLSIYNSNFLGRHDSIGHGLVSLKEFTDERTFSLKIQRPSQFGMCPALLGLFCLYRENFFHLTINRIFNIIDKYKKYKMQMKIAYYNFSKKIKEKIYYLPMMEDNCEDMILNYTAKFKIDSSNLRHDFVHVTLKTTDQAIFKKHDKTIGHFYLGPSFYYDDGTLTPWGKALVYGEPINCNFKMYL